MGTTPIIRTVVVLGGVLLFGDSAQAGSPERCQATKTKATGKLASCLARQMAREIFGQTPDFAKCDKKFSDKFAAAEAAAGPGVCPTEGDAATVGTAMGGAVQILGGGLSGVGFIDNGDGTVTDTQTGLMWEKKTDDSSIHDTDDVYTWSTSGTAPDGTAFTTFLGGLNNCTSTNSTAITGGFAGHCDWRLPTSAELHTILLEPFPCGAAPCIDPLFGPTSSSGYWSSTTGAADPMGAWGMDFNNGNAATVNKTSIERVRAVRSGS